MSHAMDKPAPAALASVSAAGEQTGTEPIRLTIGTKRENPVDARLFGQFLERASFGEPGPEGALDPATGALREDVITLAQGMRIPLVRFPGGTDVDYTDWRDLVDGAAVPGKRARELIGHTGKAIGTRFGLDEYFAFRDRIGNQTILVVNLLDALAKRLPLEVAARRAAGLVAYANARPDPRLDEDMRRWPELRAANGHPQPLRCEFIQLGNEWWLRPFTEAAQQALGKPSRAELTEWYRQCLHAYIAAIRAVDRDIGIIIDGDPGPLVAKELYEDPILRQEVAFLALHRYGPGPVDRIARHGVDGDPGPVKPDEWWWAWVGSVGSRDASGHNLALGMAVDQARSLGYRVACTEWNWNGFGFHRLRVPAGDHRVAAGLGAGGFLNGLMRQGDVVGMATQSLLIGTSWDIAAILVDQAGAISQRLPSGLVTGLYARFHGDDRLEARIDGARLVDQPLTLGFGDRGPQRITALDAVVTADQRRLYLHLINNERDRAPLVEVDASRVTTASGDVSLHRLVPATTGRDAMVEEQARTSMMRGRLTLHLPPASVTVAEITR